MTGEMKDLLWNRRQPTMIDRALLNNLGVLLGRRYERTGEIKDLDEAIQTARQAVEFTLLLPLMPQASKALSPQYLSHGPLGGPGRFWLVQNTSEVARAKGIDRGDILLPRRHQGDVPRRMFDKRER
jgi:hypothetical protein